MLNGDISNETTPRIVVMLEAIADVTYEESRKGFRKKLKPSAKWKKAELKQLWMFTDRFGLSVELAATADAGWTDSDLEKLMDKLDNRGGNPFNYFYLYDDVQELVDELPYKPNFKGVIAPVGQVARFGSWGIELQYL